VEPEAEREGCRLGFEERRSTNGLAQWNREAERKERRLGSEEQRSTNGLAHEATNP